MIQSHAAHDDDGLILCFLSLRCNICKTVYHSACKAKCPVCPRCVRIQKYMERDLDGWFRCSILKKTVVLQAQNAGLLLYYCCSPYLKVILLSSWPTGSVWSFSHTKHFIWLSTLSALIYTFICTYLLTSALPCMFFHEMSIMPNRHCSAMVGKLLLNLTFAVQLYGNTKFFGLHVFFCRFVFRIISLGFSLCFCFFA